MRDQGLDQAIRAAGGITELARRIGISQPSVSNWERIPAERVLAVEAATGVARSVLRPDLFGAETQSLDEVDAARAQEYALLATLLARAPMRNSWAGWRGCAPILALSAWRTPRLARRPRGSMWSAWGGSTSTCSSAWGAASCCPTRPTT